MAGVASRGVALRCCGRTGIAGPLLGTASLLRQLDARGPDSQTLRECRHDALSLRSKEQWPPPQEGRVPLAEVTAASQGEAEAVHPVAVEADNQREEVEDQGEEQFGAPNTPAPVGVVASMLAARRHSWCNRGTRLGRQAIHGRARAGTPSFQPGATP